MAQQMVPIMAQLSGSGFLGGGLPLKLMIDEKTNKVIFAEAGKDLVDFFFSLTVLPLGTVVSLLGMQSVPDGLANLHQSIKNLGTSYFSGGTDTSPSPDVVKAELINPSFLCSRLSQGGLRLPWKDSIAAPKVNLLYKCPTPQSHRYKVIPVTYVSEVYGASCPNCSGQMTELVKLLENRGNDIGKSDRGREKGFVKESVTYTVTDDLCIAPLSSASTLNGLMQRLKVDSLGALKEKEVIVGVAQGKKILETAMRSKCVLSDVFL